MSLSFSDLLALDVQNVFCNANEFGESFTFIPENGDARTVVGVVRADRRVENLSDAHSVTEELHILVPRDETAEGGGIATAGTRDRLSRSPSADPTGNGLPYGFTGEAADVSPAAWTMIFRRKRDVTRGTQHRVAT